MTSDPNQSPRTKRAYSDNFDKAIDQHLSDIYLHYLLGHDYSTTIEDVELLDANKKHIGKFKKRVAELGILHRYFPFLPKATSYVYSRDKTHFIENSRWTSFPFLLPLQVLEFVIEKLDTGEFSKVKLASFMLALLIDVDKTDSNYVFKTKVNSKIQINKKISALTKKLESNVDLSIEDRDNIKNRIDKLAELRKKISDHYRDEITPIIYEKPSNLYHSANIDQRAVDDYFKILGLDYGFDQWKEGIYGVRLWVWGVAELKEKLDEFIENNSKSKLTDRSTIEEMLQSGVDLNSSNKLSELTRKWEIHNIQSKYSYLSWRELEGNNLIRIEGKRGKYNVAIQNHFYNYHFLMMSLYFRRTSKQVKVKSLVKQVASEEAIKQFRNIKDVFKIEQLIKVLSDLGYGNERSPNFYNGMLHEPSDHFNQIQEVSHVVQRISKNGIYINIKQAKTIKKKFEKDYRKKYKENDKTHNNIESDVKNLDWFEIEDILVENDNDSQKEADKNKIDTIRKIISATKSLHNYKNREPRIHGLFSTHGASTHRLTCRWLNLQGISKKISEAIFSAPAGRTLISADISGQEIVVAANLAKRLYNNPEMFNNPEELRPKFDELNIKINITLEKLQDSSMEAKPKNIVREALKEKNLELFSTMTDEEINKHIKKRIFTKLFGGGKRTYTWAVLKPSERENLILELRANLIMAEQSIRTDFHIVYEGSIYSNKFLDYEKAFNPPPSDEEDESNAHIYDMEVFENKRRNDINDIEEAIYDLMDFVKSAKTHYNIDSKHSLHWSMIDWNHEIKDLWTTYNKVSEELYDIEDEEIAFDAIVEIFGNEFPGILEALDYFQLYYDENHQTYPTPLNWSTVLDFPETPKVIASKSKSYPVQATGAELMRQWLIELSTIEGYEDRFSIVNTVHDQVLVEVDNDYEADMKDQLLSALKEASNKISIHPDTLHIEYD